jgi:cephalosporin hydroxylase
MIGEDGESLRCAQRIGSSLMDWVDATIRDFHRLYVDRGLHANHGQGLHAQTIYHGVEAHKCPLDLWIFQEILWEVKPALVIELGTYLGGTTLFLAHQLELQRNGGRVVSIDNHELSRPMSSNITYLLGNTRDGAILEQVKHIVDEARGPVIVIHDAEHRHKDCLADLEAYCSWVTTGSYLIVEDTNVNGHPVLVDWGPGPWEAVETFLTTHPEFERDRQREKFLLTYNPGGYLRREQ